MRGVIELAKSTAHTSFIGLLFVKMAKFYIDRCVSLISTAVKISGSQKFLKHNFEMNRAKFHPVDQFFGWV